MSFPLVAGAQGTNFSDFAHYDKVQGSIVEPINTLYVDDIDELHTGNGVQFNSNVAVEAGKVLIVAEVEAPAGGPTEIEFTDSIAFDAGFGVFFGNTGNQLTDNRNITYTGTWNCSSFAANPSGTVILSKVGRSVVLVCTGTAAENNSGVNPCTFSVALDAVYRPAAQVSVYGTYLFTGSGGGNYPCEIQIATNGTLTLRPAAVTVVTGATPSPFNSVGGFGNPQVMTAFQLTSANGSYFV